MRRYRAAVVGCGNIGFLYDDDLHQTPPATHVAAFFSHPSTELAALVDVDGERLKRAAGRYAGATAFPEYREMLETVRPGIVAVATPIDQHRPVVEAAAKAGVRAIVCEKPIARTLEDATSMIDACREAGAMLFVNHTRRFDPLIRSARAKILAGDIGEVLQAECRYTRGIMNNGTHLLDLLRFFLGEATAVSGVSRGRVDEPLPDDMAVDGLVEFEDGASATIQHVNQGVFEVTLVGRRGRLALTRSGFRMEWTGPLGERVEGTDRSFMAAMVDHVVACCDGRDTPVSNGEDGRAALALIRALRESAQGGGVRQEMPPRGMSTR